MKKKVKIIGLVALYKPKEEDICNIEKYIDQLDYCFLLDDTGTNNEIVFKEFINKYTGKVEYVDNGKNIGLCASVNNGFKMAERNGADWVLIMNPDGTFQNNAISIYRDFISTHSTKKVAILAPVFNIDRRPKNASTGYKYISHPDMTGCIYNVKILNKLGYYDQNTFFYGLDLEYCLRVRKHNCKIIECSEAVLNHHPAKTQKLTVFGKTIFQYGKDNPDRYYYQFRSAHYINRKYHDLYNLLFTFYKLAKVLLLFDNKIEYLKMISLGIKDSKRWYFGDINLRK